MKYIYTSTYAKGMNTRPRHRVDNSPNGTVAYNTPTNGIELWIATADSEEVKAGLALVGDKWMRLDAPIEKWVAVVHRGVSYGTVKEIPDAPVEVTYPKSFTWKNTDTAHPGFGDEVEYVFNRVLP